MKHGRFVTLLPLLALAPLPAHAQNATLVSQAWVTDINGTFNSSFVNDMEVGPGPTVSASVAWDERFTNGSICSASALVSFGGIGGNAIANKSYAVVGQANFRQTYAIGRFTDYLVVSGVGPSTPVTIKMYMLGSAPSKVEAAGGGGAGVAASFSAINKKDGTATLGMGATNYSNRIVGDSNLIETTPPLTFQAFGGDILQVEGTWRAGASHSGGGGESVGSFGHAAQAFNYYIDILPGGSGGSGSGGASLAASTHPRFIGSGHTYLSTGAPEPGSFALLALAGGVALARRRRR